MCIRDRDQDDNQKSDPPGRHDDDAQPLHKYAPRVAFQVFHEGQLTLRSANVGDTPMSTTLRGFETVQLPDQSRWRVFATQGNEGDVQVLSLIHLSMCIRDRRNASISSKVHRLNASRYFNLA